MKWIVRGFLALIVLTFLALVGAAGMLLTFDPNDYKDRIASAVKETTGRDLEFGGDIKVMLFPVLGFEAERVRLGNPRGFAEKEFLSVERAQAGVQLVPLLSHKIRIETVKLVKPDITVIKQANGKTNLSFSDGRSAPAAPASQSGARDGGVLPADLSVGAIEISEAKVTYIDKAARATTTIDPFNLSMPGFAPGRSEPFKMDFTMRPAGGTAVRINASANIKTDRSASQFEVSGLDTDITLSPPGGKDVDLSLRANAAVDMARQVAEVKNVHLLWNGTSIEGEGKVTGFDKMDISFNVEADSIDLDALSGQERSAGTGGSGASSAQGDDRKDLLPLEMLRKLTLDGKVTVGEIKVSGLTMTDLSVPVQARGGVINADPVAFKLYDGTASAKVGINAAAASPTFTLSGGLADMQAGGLIKDKMGEDYMTGLANITFDLQSRGNNVHDIKGMAAGTVAFKFSDGYINKWQLSEYINKAIAYFETGKLPEDAPDKIYFTSLNGTFNGKYGRFLNTDLVLVGPKSHALGSGDVNLGQNLVDYVVRVGLGDDPATFQTAKHLPIRISGPLSQPAYSIDLQGLLMEATQQQIEEKKQELVNKALEKLSGKKQAEPAAAEAGASGAEATQPAAGGEKPAEPNPAELLKGLLGGQ